MAKKPTNKEFLQMAIDEELMKFGNWILKNSDNLELYYYTGLGGYLVRKPMEDILEMYKTELLLNIKK